MYPNELTILERAETVAFTWPMNRQVSQELTVENYLPEIIEDMAAFEIVQKAIGWNVTNSQWRLIADDLKPLKFVFKNASLKDIKDRINGEEPFKRLSLETKVTVI